MCETAAGTVKACATCCVYDRQPSTLCCIYCGYSQAVLGAMLDSLVWYIGYCLVAENCHLINQLIEKFYYFFYF